MATPPTKTTRPPTQRQTTTTTTRPRGPQKPKTYGVYVVKTVPAPRLAVWRAWTLPNEFKRWFGPEDGYRVVDFDLNPKPGSKFRIGLLPPGEGEPTLYVGGSLKLVKAPNEMQLTWKWEGVRTWTQDASLVEPPETTVSIRLEDRDNEQATEVYLAQESFTEEKERDAQSWAWHGCLNRLAALI